jgi:hypothetical protein
MGWMNRWWMPWRLRLFVGPEGGVMAGAENFGGATMKTQSIRFCVHLPHLSPGAQPEH